MSTSPVRCKKFSTELFKTYKGGRFSGTQCILTTLAWATCRGEIFLESSVWAKFHSEVGLPLYSHITPAAQCSSGGLPIRQNRQLPKARHGAGARPVQRKARKNVLLKHLFHSFIISKLLCIVFMLDVHVFVKQHKLDDLVQCIVLVESIFLFLLYNS